MSLRQFVVTALALLGGAHAASSCCFVVQDEAHEVYWSEYATEIYTAAVNLTSITTLLTPYPTTTITNYETHVYPTNKVFTTSFLVTENPVSLYTNPAYAIPQKTEILPGSVPTVTGGVTVNSPTGFWVYSTAKVFAAPAVTDLNGNVACGTSSSFSNVATDAAACVPTFTGINSNAAANFDSNGGQGVEISLTTPFIHVPTRAALQVSPSEVCAQGNGSENYGYPVQQLINHLAENPFYSAQYPGIESCIPAGPSIQAVEALAVSVAVGSPSSNLGADPPSLSVTQDPPPVNISSGSISTSLCVGDCGTTETPGGGLTSSTTTTVAPTGPTSSSTTSSVTPVISITAAPGSTSTTLVTSTSVLTALPDSSSTTSPTSSGGETPISSGGLLPTTSASTSAVSSLPTSSVGVISPLFESTSSTPVSTLASSQPAAPTSVALGSASSESPTGAFNLSTSSEIASTTTLGVLNSTGVLETISEGASITTGSPFIVSGITSALPGSSTEVSSTTTGSGPVSPAPVTASSVKEFVPWELLVSLIGLITIGVW